MKVKDAKTGASIEVPGQMETEMTGTQRYSKMTTIINDVSINQPESFEWKNRQNGNNKLKRYYLFGACEKNTHGVPSSVKTWSDSRD